MIKVEITRDEKRDERIVGLGTEITVPDLLSAPYFEDDRHHYSWRKDILNQ